MKKTPIITAVVLSAIALFSIATLDERAQAQATKAALNAIATALSTWSIPEPTVSRPVLVAGQLYAVDRVVDGDTLRILVDGQSVAVRMIGVNAPESVDPRRPVECFGKEAAEHARALLEGKQARIEKDSTQDTFDKYDRVLGYVLLADGTNINQQMIADGFAHEYTYSAPYRLQAAFKTAQQQAQSLEKGLWAPGACR